METSMESGIPIAEKKIVQVVAAAKEILKDHPDGLRFSVLLKEIRKRGLNFDSLETLVQWLP